MSFTYGFYNSLNHDRIYDATQFSAIFDGIINDGVYMSIGDHFAVTATGGMGIVVGSGRAWFNGTWSLNDGSLPFEIAPADPIEPRIDRVVIEINTTQSVRANSIKVIEGLPSSSPSPKALTNTETIHQYDLAQISVPAAATSISQGNITNKVGTTGTPFVTGIISTIDITSLIAQWQGQWNDYIVSRENDFDTWAANEKTSFQGWETTQKTEFAAWETTQKTEFSAWESLQKAAFDAWFATIVNTLDTDTAGALYRRITAAEGIITEQYNPDSAYVVGNFVIHNDVLHECVENTQDPAGTFDSSKWRATSIIDSNPFSVIDGKICVTYDDGTN